MHEGHLLAGNGVFPVDTVIRCLLFFSSLRYNKTSIHNKRSSCPSSAANHIIAMPSPAATSAPALALARARVLVLVAAAGSAAGTHAHGAGSSGYDREAGAGASASASAWAAAGEGDGRYEFGSTTPLPFGHALLKEFMFDTNYTCLNQGSCVCRTRHSTAPPHSPLALPTTPLSCPCPPSSLRPPPHPPRGRLSTAFPRSVGVNRNRPGQGARAHRVCRRPWHGVAKRAPVRAERQFARYGSVPRQVYDYAERVRREAEGNPDLFFRQGMNLTGRGTGKDATPYFSYLDKASTRVWRGQGCVSRVRCRSPRPCS